MGGTTNLIVLLCLFLSETFGLPAGEYNKADVKPNCYPGSRDKRCPISGISSLKYQCPPNDHECNINSHIPGIEIIQIIPSDPDSSTSSSASGSTTTTRRPLPVVTTTQKVKPPSSIAGCPPYPILHPTGSDCRIPISQYGCTVDSQDPWCRFFTFMYLTGGMKS